MKRALLLASCSLLLAAGAAAGQPQWKRIDGLYGGIVNALLVRDSVIIAGTDGGIFRSPTANLSWDRRTSGRISVGSVHALAAHPSGTLIASTEYAGTARSTDGGRTWESVYQGSANFITSFCNLPDGRILGGSYWGGILVSADTGKSWMRFALDTVRVLDLGLTRGGALLAVGWSALFESADTGRTWSRTAVGDGPPLQIAEGIDGSIYALSLNDLIRTTDEGRTWMILPRLRGPLSAIFADSKGRLFVGSYDEVFLSINGGATWEAADFGGRSVSRFGEDSAGIVYAGTRGCGIWYSEDGYAWLQANEGLTASRASLLCESRSGALFARSPEGLQRSTDNGDSWAITGVPMTQSAPAVVTESGIILAVLSDGGIGRSDDDGITWRRVLLPEQTSQITAFAASQTGPVYAGLIDGAVLMSTDDGWHWRSIRVADGGGEITTMTVTPAGTLYVNRKSVIARTGDSGATWRTSAPGPSPRGINRLAQGMGGRLFAATTAGVYYSEDEGATWRLTPLPSPSAYFVGIATDDRGLVVAATPFNTYLSRTNGETWEEISGEVPWGSVTDLALTSGGLLFAGTYNQGLFVSAVTLEPSSLPPSPRLLWAFPNPFNPGTMLEFSVFDAGEVRVVIFDALGRIIAEPVAGHMDAGFHRVRWIAAGLPSGTYYCRITEGRYSQVEPLILLK